MKIDDVKKGQIVSARVGDRRVACEVMAIVERPNFRSGRHERRVQLRRVDSGLVLPKWRPASALVLVRDVQPQEARTA